MQLYNTLTRSLEEFKPLSNKEVTFYHCGPTVYWVQHIGNLRAMTWADLIRRSLIFLGYKVKFVRNYTDVGHLTSDEDEGEDKMEKGARREHLSPQEIADKYIKIFEKDTADLNILKPDFLPKASDYIKSMQEMISTLLEKGYAYITNQAVVYDISKFKNYNQLNRQKMSELIKGLGKGNQENSQKRHFADFNLWVFKKGIHKNALQTWPSPWGDGFPGWHIECSVMAKKLLGKTIDIHMGGVEHINVHHTNEIAQSEAANAKKFVKYWLHNEWLFVDEKKMAKSEGTSFTLKQIIDRGLDPLVLRYFFLQAHYRSSQNFTWEGLSASQTALRKLKQMVIELKNSKNSITDYRLLITDYKKKFEEFLSHDFQIPQALALVWDMLKSNLSLSEKLTLLYEFDQVLGLNLANISAEKIPPEIIELAEKRLQAKNSKDFKLADEIRKKILLQHYSIEDTKESYKLRKL